jgi:putative ABC transport system permease protein
MIRPPRFPEAVLRRLLADDTAVERIGDFEEAFREIANRKSPAAAAAWYIRQTIIFLPVFLKNSIIGGVLMFKSYLKIGLRNLLKRRGYSALNTGGLAVGLAACLLILIFVRYELSYENFHADKDRIVRFETQGLEPNGAVRSQSASLAPGFVPYLQRDFPAIEKIARLFSFNMFGDTFVRLENKSFREKKIYLADPELLDIFTLPLVEGDPKTAISDPNTIVLSASTARRYFGKEPALGKMLTVDNNWFGSQIYRVTGVMKDTPANSHVHFDVLGALSTAKANPELREYLCGSKNFMDNVTYIYARLAKNATIASLTALLPSFLDRVMVLPTRMDQPGRIEKPSQSYNLAIRRLGDIHLDARSNGELEPNGERKYLAFFTILALAILLIACINFTNLATAKASQRAREVGLRKVVGGHRRMLAGQFMAESVLVVFLALFLSGIFVLLALPLFSTVVGRHLSAGAILRPGMLSAIGLVFLFTSFVAGIYPAFYLSAFKPAAILRGELTRGAKGAFLRKVLVVFQFAVSVVLIVSVSIVGRQMRYMRMADLGLDREHVVLLPADGVIMKRWPDVRQSLTDSPTVLAAALSKRAPSGELKDGARCFLEMNNGQPVMSDFKMPRMIVSHEFFKTFGIQFSAGRDFSTDFPTDATDAYILNETAVRYLGWKNPQDAVDKPFGIWRDRPLGRIIGVTADYHYESLRTEIKPIVAHIALAQTNTMSVRIAPGDPRKALDHIRSVWARFRPGQPFEYDFLDARLNALYGNEERMMKMFGAAGVLAIMVAGLGLFGLAAFSAEQKTREIGIRKILGASAPGLVAMFSRQFLLWVLAANVIAGPAAFLLMNGWLKNFAYREPIGWTVFAAAAALTLVVALLTVVSQSVRAALADPAASLRHE